MRCQWAASSRYTRTPLGAVEPFEGVALRNRPRYADVHVRAQTMGSVRTIPVVAGIAAGAHIEHAAVLQAHVVVEERVIGVFRYVQLRNLLHRFNEARLGPVVVRAVAN